MIYHINQWTATKHYSTPSLESHNQTKQNESHNTTKKDLEIKKGNNPQSQKIKIVWAAKVIRKIKTNLALEAKLP